MGFLQFIYYFKWYFRINHLTISCYSFIDVRCKKFYLQNESSKKFKFIIAMQLNYFGHQMSYVTKNSHSVLSLKIIFNNLLADNLMFSFNFLESKELEQCCFTKWFVSHSLESFTFLLLLPIFQIVIYFFFWCPESFTTLGNAPC